MAASRGFRPGRRSAASSRARGGFTVVEVSVLATILVTGVLGLVAAVIAGLRLVVVNREMAVGHQAARAMIERIQDTPFAQIFATYNANPNDDPGGAGTAPGAPFAVAGMTLQAGDADGFVGLVSFPTIPNGAGQPVLSESFVDGRWRMPRDLDGDGGITNGPLPGGFMILPVRVRIAWRGAGGNRAVEMDHVLIAH